MKAGRILALAIMLGGCTVGPDYAPPAPLPPADVSLGTTDANPVVTPAPPPEQWWRLFEDAALDRLVEQALAHNNDLRVAAANVRRARALLREAGAAWLPETNVSASATRSRINAANGANTSGGATRTNDYYAVGFDASYEVDLFGGVTRSIQAARADLGATQAALDSARISIAAETARTYAAACGYAYRANTARETIQLQEKTLDLTQRLLAGGRGTRRDVDQSITLVEQARAQAASFDAERRAALFALAVLTGVPPTRIDTAAASCERVPTVSQPIPIGDGQELLARRPDVHEAERRLAAATARIGVATAALYPSIRLLGSIGFGANDVDNLTKSSSLNYSFGPLISFNFPFNNAARARVEQSKAVSEGALAAFDQSILTALQETEQALARVQGTTDSEVALKRALASSDNAAQIAELRFQRGADNFLQLLDAQRERANVRAALAAASAARAEAQISLFKALGGGWQHAPQPEPR